MHCQEQCKHQVPTSGPVSAHLGACNQLLPSPHHIVVHKVVCQQGISLADVSLHQALAKLFSQRLRGSSLTQRSLYSCRQASYCCARTGVQPGLHSCHKVVSSDAPQGAPPTTCRSTALPSRTCPSHASRGCCPSVYTPMQCMASMPCVCRGALDAAPAWQM